MSGSGGPQPNRIVTFLEVNFSQNWYSESPPDPYDGSADWNVFLAGDGAFGSISITRSDGKVLYFDVTNNDGVVQTRENVIRWTAYDDIWPGSNGPFQ